MGSSLALRPPTRVAANHEYDTCFENGLVMGSAISPRIAMYYYILLKEIKEPVDISTLFKATIRGPRNKILPRLVALLCLTFPQTQISDNCSRPALHNWVE